MKKKPEKKKFVVKKTVVKKPTLAKTAPVKTVPKKDLPKKDAPVTGPSLIVLMQRNDTTTPNQWFQAFHPDDKTPVVLEDNELAAKAIVGHMAKATPVLVYRLVRVLGEYNR